MGRTELEGTLTMNMLIINADDFGYSKGINLGILEAHREGILSSTTIMANMPGFDHAVSIAKENPKLGVGVHLTLTCHKPLNPTVTSLMDDEGDFKRLSYFEKGIDIDIDLNELFLEWDTQIKKVIKSGISPTHLDSHHHVNSIKPLTEVFEDLARKYDLPVRNNYEVSNDLVTTKRFITQLDALGTEKNIWKPMIFRNIIEDVLTYGSVECMCHPGFIDYELLERSSFTKGRAYQVKELQNDYYKQIIQEAGITLQRYSDL